MYLLDTAGDLRSIDLFAGDFNFEQFLHYKAKDTFVINKRLRVYTDDRIAVRCQVTENGKLVANQASLAVIHANF